ncbi:MAG: 3-hydroxyacyl-CoA dehydrogenase family protein [Proteobacteria bacterium]|nr:3-hydroxyacyl-CoA dehydrogenase family protein [Pseudomonadota bacterium]
MGTDWIRRILVVGAGTMGHSLAQTFAQGGYSVALVDLKREALDNAVSLIASNLRTLEDLQLLEKGKGEEIIERIHLLTSLEEGARDADLAIEAIFEDYEAKGELFERFERLCPSRTILASNTSYLNIFELTTLKRLEKIIITHWYAPPHIIPLVEVVRGPHTSRETVEIMRKLLCKLGKKPVIMDRFIPGFIVNRLQRALAREIFHLLDNGYATAEDIDTAVKASLGIRIPILGVVQRYDFTGIDLVHEFMRNPSIHLVSEDKPSETIERLVDRGHLGVKSGRGFYDYSGKKMNQIMRARDIKMIKLKEFLEGI